MNGSASSQPPLQAGSAQRGHFASAVLVIDISAVVGSIFHFSDSWQLVIKAGTTIVTFLMSFSLRTRKTAMREQST